MVCQIVLHRSNLPASMQRSITVANAINGQISNVRPYIKVKIMMYKKLLSLFLVISLLNNELSPMRSFYLKKRPTAAFSQLTFTSYNNALPATE